VFGFGSGALVFEVVGGGAVPTLPELTGGDEACLGEGGATCCGAD